jgi:hypothetical protein
MAAGRMKGCGMGITSLRRRELVRAVLANAQETGEAIVPWARLGGVEQHFRDQADLLVELHREWLRLLVGRLHRGEIVVQRSPANVRDLYDEVAAAHPTLRRILDAHAADPALWDPTAREHAMLARVAGLAADSTFPEQAAALGRGLVTQRIPLQRNAL